MQIAVRSRQGVLAALAVVVVILAALAVYLITSRSTAAADDQCGKPVTQRSGGWFCYTPLDAGSPSPGAP